MFTICKKITKANVYQQEINPWGLAVNRIPNAAKGTIWVGL